ncbi:hypothetical protein FQA39_LY13938 [Lamprigera yunnana]|nr:hypothetical protein FQA39_LY13938 [Lamprigera yunnana]
MESPNNNHIPTNEEVIEELTRDLEQHTFADSAPNENNFEEPPAEDGCNEKPINNDCNDFIDEEELKKVNDNLSDEEKQSRLETANELKKEGNEHYKKGEYRESISKYTDALRLYPLENTLERSVVYSNKAASKKYLGFIESAIDDCTKSIELNPNYVRALLRRAKLYEENEKLDESLDDYKKILELDPGNVEAMMAGQRLPPLIHERNEKLKTEMLAPYIYDYWKLCAATSLLKNVIGTFDRYVMDEFSQ